MASKQVVDHEYHFPTWVDLIGLIYDQSIDIKSLLNSLIDSNLEDKDIRDIIFLGIQSHHIKNQKFDIIQKTTASLSDTKYLKNATKSASNSTCTTSTPSSYGSHCSDNTEQKQVSRSKSPFDVQSLHCQIFQMLDFYDVQRCSMVCKDWLHRCYDKSSFSQLDLQDILKVSDMYCSNCDHTSGYKYQLKYKNLKRFQNIKIINIIPWPGLFSQCFSNLSQSFRKLEGVTITETENLADNDPEEAVLDVDENYAREIINLLKMNCNSIKSLKFESYDNMQVSEKTQKIINDSMGSIHFKTLHTLDLQGCIDGEESLLKHAPDKLTALHVGALFETPRFKLWKNVAERRDFLQNLRILDLTCVWVGRFGAKSLKAIYYKLVSNLKSLRVLKIEDLGLGYVRMSDLIYHMRRFDHFSQLRELEFEMHSEDEYLEPLDMVQVERDGSFESHVSEGFVNLKRLQITIFSQILRNQCKIQLQNLFDIIKPSRRIVPTLAPLEEMIIIPQYSRLPISADSLIGLIVQSGIVSSENLKYLEIGETVGYDDSDFANMVCGMVQLDNFLKTGQFHASLECFTVCVNCPMLTFLRQKEKLLKTMISILCKWYNYGIIKCCIKLHSKSSIIGPVDRFFAELKSGKWSDRCQLELNDKSVFIKLTAKQSYIKATE